MKLEHDRFTRAKRTVHLLNSCTVSIDQAIAIALASIGGTVFDAKVKEVSNETVWRVKLVRSGERVKVYVDARSGKILEAKAEKMVIEPYRKISPETPTMAVMGVSPFEQ